MFITATIKIDKSFLLLCITLIGCYKSGQAFLMCSDYFDKKKYIFPHNLVGKVCMTISILQKDMCVKHAIWFKQNAQQCKILHISRIKLKDNRKLEKYR